MALITSSKKAVLISLILIAPLFIVPQTIADNTTEVNTFMGGAQTLTIVSDGSNVSNDLQLELTRNVTYQDASFMIKFENPAQSPGSVYVNNSFGNEVWAFDSPGYGNLGAQNSFEMGNTYDRVPLNSGSSVTTPVLLPLNASLQSSSLNVSYTPQIDGQYIPVGSVLQMELGYANNDTMTDAFVLSNDNSTTGLNTSFAVVMSNSTNQNYALSNWTSTCPMSNVMRIADMNNDSFDDVVTFQSMDNKMCIHHYNASNSSYDPYTTVNLPSQPIDVQIADIDRDGKLDFVTLHGPNGNGNVTLSLQITPNLFVPAHNVSIDKWNVDDGRAAMRALRVGNFFVSNQTTILATDDNNDVTLVYFDTTTKILMQNNTKYRNITSQSVAGDIDNDGDVDFITPHQAGSYVLLNNGTGWVQSSSNQFVDTWNATIADHDKDGQVSFFSPVPMESDGNPATIEGGIQLSPLSSTGLGMANPSMLQPYSQPYDILFSDINNDGLMDQFVLSGEGSQGVFIGSWHNITLDANLDGIIDLWGEGYSSSTIPNLGVLTISDVANTIKTAIEPSFMSYPSMSDGYGIEMVSFFFEISTNSNGTANVSDLNLAYDVEFTVSTNQGILGTLSNALNQQMEAGTGTFSLTLPVETSLPGSFDAIGLRLISIPGAPNIALPPDPVLTSTATAKNVTLEWQAISEFGSNFVEFELYKASSIDALDYSSPDETFDNASSFVDEFVTPGKTYVYVVRSTHLFGVVSNFSSPLEVNVPYPAPPASVTNVQLIDLDISTQSSPLKVTWDQSIDSDLVSEFRIYVAKSDLTLSGSDPFNLTTDNYTVGGTDYQPVGTIPASVLEFGINQTSAFSIGTATSPPEAIQDGVQYWVAVAAVDEYGNASAPLPISGPTTAFNNTYITSQLEVTITAGPPESPSNILESSSPMKIILQAHYLDDFGQVTPIENAELELKLTYGEEEIVLNGQSNSSGYWTAIDAENLYDSSIPQTLLDYSANPTGTVNVHASMQSIERPNTQPYTSANRTDSIGTGMLVELVGPQSPVDMDANAEIDINVSLHAIDSVNPAHQTSLEDTKIVWEAYDNTSQEPLISGFEVISAGQVRIVAKLENMTRIELSVDPQERTLFGTTEIVLSLNAYSVPTQNNETNQNETEWIPTSIQSVIIECEASTLLTNQQSSDDPIACNLNNPNPFSVNVEVFVTESPPLFKSPNDATIEANGTTSISFIPKYEDSLWARQNDVNAEKEFSIQILTTSLTYDLSTSQNSAVTWTADLFVADEPTTGGDEQSSSNTVLWGGIGAGILLLATVGFVLYRRASADFEDESYYEEDETFPEENDEPIEIPTGKPLDEFDDVSISDQPETIERPGDALISEVENMDGKTIEEEFIEDTSSDSELDDGISTDEFGTEWYEDEVGTWWFREAGEEDWSEYND